MAGKKKHVPRAKQVDLGIQTEPDGRTIDLAADGGWWRLYKELEDDGAFLEIKHDPGERPEIAFPFEIDVDTDGVRFFRVKIPLTVLDQITTMWMSRKETAIGNNPPAKIKFTNFKGHTAWRSIEPIGIWYGSVTMYKGEQWFLYAVDLDQGTNRNFPLGRIKAWKTE